MRTTRDLVAHNVAGLRRARGLSVRDLSAVMERLGRKILPSGITAIEKGERGVSAEDLVALALALGVMPNRLLLPADSPDERVQLTPTTEVYADRAWNWAGGRAPLLMHADTAEKVAAEYDDFSLHAWPASERRANEHTAARAVRDVANRLHEVLQGQTDRGPALRRALNRLVAEVDDLLGDDDGR